MFMKNITLRVIIFGIVSLFVGLPLAQAYPNMVGGNTQSEYQTAVTDRNNAYREEEKWETRYGEAKSIVDDLLGKWSGNEDAIKDGTWSLVNTAAATLIAEIIRRTNNDDGKSSAQQMIEILPTILGIVNAVRDGIQLSTDRAERNDYLSALSTAVGALDLILASNQSTFAAYETKYDKYVELMAASSHQVILSHAPYTVLRLRLVLRIPPLRVIRIQALLQHRLFMVPGCM